MDAVSDAGSDAGAEVEPEGDVQQGGETPEPEVDVRAPSGGLGVDRAHVALPFVTQGEPVPEGSVTLVEVSGLGGLGELSIEIEGDFEVEGSMGPLSAGERRAMGLRYTGSVDSPRAATGRVLFEAGGEAVEVTLAAVIGHPGLPASDWRGDVWGERQVVPMPSAPYPHSDGPWTDSSVVIFVPDGLTDSGQVGVVTHLHGLRADVAQVVGAQKLIEQHALSGRDAVFIAPQGPYRAGSNAFGKLDEAGGFERLVRDVIAILYRDGRIQRPGLGEVVVTAHSGGYKPTASVLDHGGLAVLAAHLLDALYGRVEIYRAFIEGGGMLRSSYTTFGGTVENNEALALELEEAGTPVASTFTDGGLLDHAVAIYHTPFTHGDCVRGDRTFERWLRISGLPRGHLSPPDFLAAEVEGAQARLSWRDEGGPRPARIRVEGSEDGETWAALAETTETSVRVPARPWFRLVAVDPTHGDSLPSDRYGATGDDWLVVDGFDRRLGGSWDVPSHGFASALGEGLGAPFSTASNEAVVEGLVELADYGRVLWLLGDESEDDVTFDEGERAAIERFLSGGGRLLVSGAEVGYATEATWLGEVLRTRYVSDNARTARAGGYTFGVTYEEDYPDVLDGDTVLWRYESGGGAAVGWDHRIIAVGFALETIGDDQRAEALQELVTWLR